uniref:Chitobiosyldiphosphodolichol beta-mannosyltransferase n=1 Tax=Caenorhabditis japonica TaxID=281687 RepID=A0A8R1IQ68_CAEJA
MHKKVGGVSRSHVATRLKTQYFDCFSEAADGSSSIYRDRRKDDDASLIPQWQSACKGSEAAVVVLGDVGRSPRMCNHAIMLAEAGYRVKIFGFHDSDPEIPMTDHEPIEIVGIRAPPEMRSLPAAVQLPVKFVWNVFTLFFTLFFRTSHLDLRVILMQNPPGLPTMLVCYLISRLKTARLTVDWHNYTYSILRDKYNLEEEKLFRAGWKSAKEM